MKQNHPEGLRSFGGLAVTVAAMAMASFFAYRVQRGTSGTTVWRHAQTKAFEKIETWPETPRLTARLMIDRYGAPDVSGRDSLVWSGRHPWKRIVVHRLRRNPLEHVVDYDVPADKLEPVRALGHSIEVNAWAGELSASSDREQLNCLALNLAHEVALGLRTSAAAREFYVKIAIAAASGKTSPYMTGLIFQPLRRAGGSRIDRTFRAGDV